MSGGLYHWSLRTIYNTYYHWTTAISHLGFVWVACLDSHVTKPVWVISNKQYVHCWLLTTTLCHNQQFSFVRMTSCGCQLGIQLAFGHPPDAHWQAFGWHSDKRFDRGGMQMGSYQRRMGSVDTHPLGNKPILMHWLQQILLLQAYPVGYLAIKIGKIAFLIGLWQSLFEIDIMIYGWPVSTAGWVIVGG